MPNLLKTSNSSVVRNIESNPISQKTQINYGQPKYIKIPSLNIDASLISVGLNSKGEMEAPKNPEDVAWYEPGKRPGEIGSAVIAGHYGEWKNGKLSIFENLNKLHKGDKLSVEDDNGSVVNFVVRESKSYEPDADAKEIFESNDGKSHLNLITCEGEWNNNTKSYSRRLVVFTDKE